MGKGHWAMDSSSMNKKYVILAPHVDDEVIGCYRYLSSGVVSDVVYFFDITPERKAEAELCANTFKFNAHFLGIFPFDLPDFSDSVILIPNIADKHPHHKLVNQVGRKKYAANAKKFYSIDMNVPFDVLSEKDRNNKRWTLVNHFPSQASLFDDDRYSFFESSLDSDLITQIEVKTQFEGIHLYPNAPEEVSFLRHPHRHMFHVAVVLDVFHDDREVEFFILQRQINAYIKGRGEDMNYRSCEMISKEILEHVIGMYPGRSCEVRVFEDGENGSIVKYNWR